MLHLHVEAVEADGGHDVDALLVADDFLDADDLADVRDSTDLRLLLLHPTSVAAQTAEDQIACPSRPKAACQAPGIWHPRLTPCSLKDGRRRRVEGAR